ncbi:MAG TPA: zf-HC2 domain-containing protein [Candidatus Dormibacteraeota bacterium]|nr:zf-HC2 domain-containing protein [Candidatus Dormibacteraeota bacterium]
MQDPWIERLSEYVDEELSRPDREALEQHLLRCTECSSAVEDLMAVRERARNLPEASVPAELWSRIESSIATGRLRSVPSQEARPERAKESGRERTGRLSFSLPQLVAACLAVALLSGAGVFALMKLSGRASRIGPTVAQAPPSGAAREGATQAQAPSRQGAEEPRSIAASNATVPATGSGAVNTTRTEATPHEEAIAELRKALARERDRLDPATVRALESNLAIIDLAIDQAKRALAADPANTYVKEHLAETMRRKVELLQRATLLASTANSEGTR